MKKECNTVSFKNQVIYVGIDIHKFVIAGISLRISA